MCENPSPGLGEGVVEDPGEGEKLTKDVQLFPDQDEFLAMS